MALLTLVASACGGGSGSTVSNSNSGGMPTAATVSDTIPVGTDPIAVAIDSTNNKIYVSDSGTELAGAPYCHPTGADVTVIDGPTGSTIAVPLGDQVNPMTIALNSRSHAAYIVQKEWMPNLATGKGCFWVSDGLIEIDTSTLSGTEIYKANIVGCCGFVGIDINQSTGDVYLSDAGTAFPPVDNSVIVVGSNAATIPVGANPAGVAINAATNKIYVANSGSNDISVIDGTANSVVATIADSKALSPVAVAVNPATNTIYVANLQSNNVTVIDGATDSVMATISVGTSPSGIDVDSQTKFIYVANAGNSQTGDPGNVTVINGATNATTMLTDPKARNPVAIAANSITNKIYVANSGSNNVTVINGAHN